MNYSLPGFPETNFERGESEELRERQMKLRADRIKNEVKNQTRELEKLGLPINEDFRINIEDFRKNHKPGNLKVDQALKKEGELKESGIKYEKSMIDPEILINYLFNKYFSNKIITIRTSLYDECLNGITNLVINKETGELIGAINAKIENPKIGKARLLKTEEKNSNGGATVDFGIKLNPKNQKIELEKNSKKIPVLLIEMERETIENIIMNHFTAAEKNSDISELRRILTKLMEQNDAMQINQYMKNKPSLSNFINNLIMKNQVARKILDIDYF